MSRREPLAVFFFGLLTGGIYSFFWFHWTKQEMRARGADIPTLWLIIIPFVSLYWLWKWCSGVEKVTNRSLEAIVAFLFCWLLGPIGHAYIQSKFNATA